MKSAERRPGRGRGCVALRDETLTAPRASHRHRVVYELRDGRRSRRAEPLSAPACGCEPGRLDRTRRRGCPPRPGSRQVLRRWPGSPAAQSRTWTRTDSRTRSPWFPETPERDELAVAPPEQEDERCERGGREVRRESDATSSLALDNGRPGPQAFPRVAPYGPELLFVVDPPLDGSRQCPRGGCARTDLADSPPRERCP